MEQELTSTDHTVRHPEGIDRSVPREAAQTGAGHRPLPCGRHQHVPPAALVTRNPSQLRIRSDLLTTRILLGLLDGKPYTQQPERRLAEYRQSLPKGRGYVSLTLSPRSEESWEHVLASLDLLGDELVDTFLVLLAVALDTNGTERISAPFAITADDILAICQKKKSKGSYPARQRQSVIAQVHTLARVWVRATLVLRDSKPWQVESPLLEILLSSQDEENKTCSEHTSRHPWHLKIGDWATGIPEFQSQIALMARQVLQYHARKQKYEKRLGRYLTVLYRINAHRHEGRVRVSMGVLLEHAGIALDRDNPGRTRDAIESALNHLHRDGVIGPFIPLVERSSKGREAQERIEQHAYHWWDDYRQQRWLFEPPAYLKALYQSIHREEESPTEGGDFPTEGGLS
jgi:hypothetical protein